MYNGRPPMNQGYPPYMPPGVQSPGFRPPLPGMPPPTLSPAPGGMPPFAPPNGQHGFRPPPMGAAMPNFPPNRPPMNVPGGFGGPGGGGGPPPGGMPPFSPGQMPTPGLPSRPPMGISPHAMGTPGGVMSPGPPGMSNMAGAAGGGATNPNFVRAVKTTKVFVGSIAPGVTDAILTGLIHTCGPLHKLNRVTGTTGKPQAFGFAEFEDPEVVLRCLKCLNGTELPDITPQGRSSGATKKLIVKADDKTREFLDEFEQLNIRTDHDDELDEHARQRIQMIVQAMRDPRADLNSIIPAAAAPEVSAAAKDNGPMVPDHLKDLDAEELPEDQRGEVLDQIALFRVQAQRKEDERKRKDEMLNARSNAPGGQSRQWGRPNDQPNGYGGQPTRAIGDGPQGYNKPVEFQRGQTAEGRQMGEQTDAEMESRRIEEKDRRNQEEYRALERRVEAREHRLLRGLTQEADEMSRLGDVEKAAREKARREMEDYDDDARDASGRDVFFADRGKWRSMRQVIRRREYQDDVRDRQYEKDEKIELEKQTEQLLQQQMKEMADLEAKQRAAGYLFDDSAHIKVAIGGTGSAATTTPSGALKPKATTAAFGADDDEDVGKKKRTLITLDDSDGLTPSQREERNREKLKALRDQVPKDKSALWATPIAWDSVTESLLENKIAPLIRKTIEAALGEADQDLHDFAMEHLRSRGAPEALVEGLEPVLDEDAEKAVVEIWRNLAYETAAYAAGLTTGSTTV